MVKHILSIDFDYIMFPCIKLYNDISSKEKCPADTWNAIEKVRGINDNFLSYDPASYIKIAELIQYTIETNNAQLISINDHQEIVDILKKEEDYDSSVYDIVNIDFHHDIMYQSGDKAAIKSFDKYKCSNWVGYLMLKDKIHRYTWIKSPNSDLYDHSLDGNNDIKFYTESSRYLDHIKAMVSDHPFTQIFFCLSPQWVPYKYHHLYDLIVKLFGPKNEEDD